MADNRELLRLATIGEVAAGMAHELRNALQVVAASAYVARQSGDTPHLAKIERNIRLAQNVVDAIMSVARGEPIHAESVSLASLFRDARTDLEERATWIDDGANTTLRVQPVLFARLLHILYENAIGVAPSKPTITTRARLEGERVRVDVIDDGPGVPEAIRETIFELFVTMREGGTGIGLPLARRIAIAHSGSLELLPAASPEGAHFVIHV